MWPIRTIIRLNMVTKSKYIPFLYVLIGFQLICHECECTNSSAHSSLETIASIEAAPSTTTMASINDTDAVGSLPMEARRLPDESIESITSYSNLLDVSTELLTNEHITPPTAYGGNYHQHSPVHHIVALHIPKPLTTPSFQMPYASTQIPSGNRVRLVQTNTAPVWSPTTALSSFERQPMASLPSHELISLENQYMDSFRNIKSSVMNMIYKVQDFMSYVMSLFTMGGETPIVEGRLKKYKTYKKLKKFKKIPKFKIKKKFKKFIIPLLLAYKLKFFALIPLIIGGLILLVGSTGMAGFFFALFTAVISLKHKEG